jgi:hypothetical protein
MGRCPKPRPYAGSVRKESMRTVREAYADLDLTPESDNEDFIGKAMIVLGYGHFQLHLGRELIEWPFWDDLFVQCVAVIQERADLPFLGGPTAASIMDAAKSRYLVRRGARLEPGKRGKWVLPRGCMPVPDCWLATITKLKTLPMETS